MRFIIFNKQISLNIIILLLFVMLVLFLYRSENNIMEKLPYQRFRNTVNAGNTGNPGNVVTSTQKSSFGATDMHLENLTPKNSLDCYRSQSETLPDISEISPRKGKSIFFHETSCRSFDRGKMTITSRQACAVESAAKLNPNLDVYLLFSSPGVFKFEGDESDQLLEALLGYRNVKIMYLNYEKYTKGTPVEELYSSGKIERSHYAVSHASDVLRFLTLWKYGGIYLDLDMIVIKSLQNLSLNFAGIESEYDVGSAILSFDSEGEGHTLTENCLNDLKQSFNGEGWTNNGPDIIKRALQAACGVETSQDMVGRACKGVKVYPEKNFFPLYYTVWESYFDENYLDDVINKTKDSYTLHIWNKLSIERKISLTSNAPYLYFARKFCPKVVSVCNTDF